MSQSIELTILMPCLNEAETVAACIKDAQAFLKAHRIAGEVLVADNGSADGSFEIAEACGARVVRVPQRGYGAALTGGAKAARGKYVIMGDADYSLDFTALMPFVEKLREGYDLVMGDRFSGGIEKGAMPFLHRYVGNPCLSFLGRLFGRVDVADFHCGLRGYNRERILALGLQSSGMEYASEMVMACALNHYRIAQVPVRLRLDGRSRRSHLRTFRDGWRHLRFLLMYCPRWLYLYPGLLLLGLGGAGLAALSRGPLTIGGVTFDIATMLYMGGFAVIGLQLVFLKILTDAYAAQTGYIPISAASSRLQRAITTEVCVLAGILMILTGIALAVLSLRGWAATHYGNLDPQRVMRTVIPAWTLLICGLLTICNGFFLGILRIPRSD